MVTLLMIWALLNVAELLLCGADKFYAKTGRWRIPEKVLLGLGLVGGSLGPVSYTHLVLYNEAGLIGAAYLARG